MQLRMTTRVGIKALREQRERGNPHVQGFAQDVHGEDGRLIHAELNEIGLWSLRDADTNEYLGTFGYGF